MSSGGGHALRVQVQALETTFPMLSMCFTTSPRHLNWHSQLGEWQQTCAASDHHTAPATEQLASSALDERTHCGHKPEHVALAVPTKQARHR